MSKEMVSLGEGLFLRVSEDGLEAWLEKEGGVVSARDFFSLRERLASLGLSGILEAPEARDGRLVVARGQAPEPGQDGRVEFLVDLSRGPRPLSGGRVDWREINALVSVPAGTPVARVHPPSPGVPGYTVWGEEIPASPGRSVEVRYKAPKDEILAQIEELDRLLEEKPSRETSRPKALTFTLGPGLRYEPEKGLIVAEEGGILEVQEGFARIHSTYTLRGDVDWETGNIHFHGKALTITGTVRRGFTVESAGELTIQGDVEEGARVRAGGRLKIAGLVRGENTLVESEGEAEVQIVEWARVRVKGKLTVWGYLLWTRTAVGGDLFVFGEKGIVGGEVYVEGSATVSVLGSPAFVKTFLRVGYNYEVAEEQERLLKEWQRLDELTDRMKEAFMQGLRLARSGRLTPKHKEALEALRRHLRQKLLEMSDLKHRMNLLEEELRRGAGAIVQVTRRVYPNVAVGIDGHLRDIRREYGPGIFRLTEAGIQFQEGV